MIRILFVFLVLFCSQAFSFNESDSDRIYEADISKNKYNRIVLPQPYKNIIVSKGARIDKPIKLNGGSLLLIRPLESAVKAFDITFVLADGESFQIIFNPVLKDRPIVWRYKDAADVQVDKGSFLNDKHVWLARLFPEAHDIYYERTDGVDAPRGFTSIKTSNGLRVAVKNERNETIELTLNPMKSWRGMGHVLNAYNLTSTGSLKLEPADFWYEGVVAVSTEFDFVSSSKNPYVFILVKDY